MQTWLVFCLALLAPVLADKCPDGAECELGNTCCETPADGYGCCPLHQAECCGDHEHCCPEGMSCVEDQSACVNASLTLPWVERMSAKTSGSSKSFRMLKSYSGDEDDNICPDASHCPPEFSCLRGLRGYGCCPLDQGVPCADGKHCCPADHQCSEDCTSCIELQKAAPVSAVLCSDGLSECPDQTTCCKTTDESWACCPLPKAVCCDDMVHCCPEGSTCNVEQSKCDSPTSKAMPMWAKFPARKRADWENQPDVELTTTGASSSYPSQQTGAGTTTPSPHARGGSVPCDDTVACDDGTTCCKTKEGGWNCCPLPEAVCCEDFEHCCPHGTTCDLVQMKCVEPLSLGSGPLLEKVAAKPWKADVAAGNVTCDSSHGCPDQTTCCKTTAGEWGCCPFPEAICCEDHEHCCPHGTTCDLAAQTCDSPTGPVAMEPKVAAHTTLKPSPVSSTPAAKLQLQEYDDDDDDEDDDDEEDSGISCDSHTTCPSHTTCCFMQSSQKYGCCPLPEAVCCTDGNHCCPKGYECDGASNTCTKGLVVIPWYNKLEAEAENHLPSPRAVECDDSNRCPEGSTCCALSEGQWGCCPLTEAVCCPDQEHCCPLGYRCNMASRTCQRPSLLHLQTVPLTQVYMAATQSRPLAPQGNDIHCGDTTSTATCDDGQTCCKTSATEWGCCPIPNAVCCSDMAHCCPAGTTCDGAGSCSQSTELRWDYWHATIYNRRRAGWL